MELIVTHLIWLVFCQHKRGSGVGGDSILAHSGLQFYEQIYDLTFHCCNRNKSKNIISTVLDKILCFVTQYYFKCSSFNAKHELNCYLFYSKQTLIFLV